MKYWTNALKKNLPVKGKVLDQLGVLYKLERKRYYLIFKESDKSFKKRLQEKIKDIK